MGKWTVIENERGFWSFLHLNLLNGVQTLCGELRTDTPPEMILEWIVNCGSSTPGDVVRFADGQVLTLLPTEARA